MILSELLTKNSITIKKLWRDGICQPQKYERQKTWLSTKIVVNLSFSIMNNLIANRKIKSFPINKLFIKIGFAIFIGSYFFLDINTLRVFSRESNTSHKIEISSRKSFVSNAVNRSGPAVVTLETQRTIISQNNYQF